MEKEYLNFLKFDWINNKLKNLIILLISNSIVF